MNELTVEMFQCEACDEEGFDEDAHIRNDCGCKLLCHKCVDKHDKECKDYLNIQAKKCSKGETGKVSFVQ